jgi:DNA replication protein DnaC
MCELPERSEQMTFANYNVYPQVREAHDAAVMIAKNELDWLTLIGNVDCGKTHLAVAICREWITQGKPAKYAYVPLLLDELRQGIGQTGSEAYTYRFNVYCSIPLLVLDDYGTQKASEWAQERLDTIVDYRYMHKLPLVVTSNLRITEMPDRIASRLQRYENGVVIGIDTREYRLRAK